MTNKAQGREVRKDRAVPEGTLAQRSFSVAALRLVCALCVALALAGCVGGPARRKVEQAIEPALPKLIGPADSYSVKVDAGVTDLMNNHLDGIRIVGKNVMMDGKYFLDDLVVDMRDVEFDPEARTLKKAGTTRVQVALYESSMPRYVTKDHPDIKNAEVKVSDGIMTVMARPEMMKVSARIEAVGQLRIHGDSQLYFTLVKLNAGGVPVPDAVARPFINRLNPVLDLSSLRMPLKLTSVKLVPGKVLLNATADLTRGLPASG